MEYWLPARAGGQCSILYTTPRAIQKLVCCTLSRGPLAIAESFAESFAKSWLKAVLRAILCRAMQKVMPKVVPKDMSDTIPRS